MTSNTSKTDAWLYAVGIQPNALTSANQTELTTKHGFDTVQMEGLRANGSKKRVDFLVFTNQHLNQEVEIFIKQTERFIQFADQTNLNDQARFDAFSETIGGHVKDLFNVIRDDGTRWYDPGHADADTNDGFAHMLKALFVSWSKHNNPADSLATRIMGLEWKNHTIRGTFYSPDDFKLRMQSLWRINEMLPLIGAPTTDAAKLKATWNGLTDDAQDFIKDEKGVDPFDAAHFGLDPISWTDVFDLLKAYWNREFKKTANNYVQNKRIKRKREDDDDSIHNDDDDGDDSVHSHDDDDDDSAHSNDEDSVHTDDDDSAHSENDDSVHSDDDDSGHNDDDDDDSSTHNGDDDDDADNCDSDEDDDADSYDNRSNNVGGSPVQQQQQQYFFHPLHLQGASYMTVAPASASQFPAFYANQPATSRIAPTYATGTTSMAPAQNVPTYKLQTDVNGNQYFVHI